MMKAITATVLLVSLAGCANYKPVPDGYSGPVATISDSGFSEDGSKAQLFVVSEIDGKSIQNSVGASAQASSGQGFRLTTRYVERQVPAKPMKIVLQGTHTTAAPIQALFSQATGNFFSVEGSVDFTPREGHKYVVKGELKKVGSSVWIEDAESNEVVTAKVSK